MPGVYCGKKVVKCGTVEYRVWLDGKEYALGPATGETAADVAFAWGEISQATSRLANCLLFDVGCSFKTARMYQEHMALDLLSKLPDQWVLTEQEIQDWFSTAPSFNPLRKTNA